MINLGQVTPEGLQNEHLVQKIGWQMVNLPAEVRNSYLNHSMLLYGHDKEGLDDHIKLMELLRDSPTRVKCLSEAPKGKGPIVICGSGSSIEGVAPTLKDWKGAVMCSTSQYSTLVYHGRCPDYVVCMDPRIAYPDLELDAPEYGESVMLAHPSIPRSYIYRWLTRAKGTLYLSRIMEPSYDFYTHHLGQGYDWVRHIILPMIDSVASEIGFATWLGYNPIYMAGVDYGGPRMQRWDWNYETQSWKPDRVTSGYVVTNRGNYSGLTESQSMAYSSRGTQLSTFLQMANPKWQERIYQLSSTTVLRNYPLRIWDEVLEKQGVDEEWDPVMRANILEDLEALMASWDTFLVPVASGWGPDYHTYIAKDEQSYMYVMGNYNQQVTKNLENFAEIEKRYGQTINRLVESGMVDIEAGELLLKGADEFGEWDWHRIEPIDIPYVLHRRRHLLELADKKGYKRPEGRNTIDLMEAVGECAQCRAGRNPCPKFDGGPGTMLCRTCGHTKACHPGAAGYLVGVEKSTNEENWKRAKGEDFPEVKR